MKRLILLLVAAVLIVSIPAPAQTGNATSSATFLWNADSQPVSGYKLYWGLSSGVYGTPVDCGNVTTYTLTGLPVVGPIYVAATAYATGQESVFSNEVIGYSLTVTSDGNSTISPNGVVWTQSGTSRTFTVNPKAGFDAMVNLDGVLIGRVTGGTYQILNVSANHTISITSTAQIPAPTGLVIK